jgi:hypothetical protein
MTAISGAEGGRARFVAGREESRLRLWGVGPRPPSAERPSACRTGCIEREKQEFLVLSTKEHNRH